MQHLIHISKKDSSIKTLEMRYEKKGNKRKNQEQARLNRRARIMKSVAKFIAKIGVKHGGSYW